MRVQALALPAALLVGVGLWLLVAWVVALAMARLAERTDPDGPPFLARETWAVITACGAAAGAVLGFSSVAPSMWLRQSLDRLAALSLVTGGAMVAGATATGLLALIVVWLRAGR